MTAISSADVWTAVRDYSVTLVISFAFIALFALRHSNKVKKAFAAGNPRPKSYFLIVMLSMVATMIIGVTTEYFLLKIFKYGYYYYAPGDYFEGILFLSLFLSMLVISKILRKKANFLQIVAGTILVATGALVFGVYQLRESAYPLRSTAFVKTQVTEILSNSPLAKINMAILNKDSTLLQSIQSQAIATIYESQGKNAQKYGLDSENYDILRKISFATKSKNTARYVHHATDTDSVAVFKTIVALLNHSSDQGNCNLKFGDYVVSISEDKPALELQQSYVEAMVALITNSDLTRQIALPSEGRLISIYEKVVPEEFREDSQKSKKLPEKRYCLLSLLTFNRTLKLQGQELVELSRFFLKNMWK